VAWPCSIQCEWETVLDTQRCDERHTHNGEARPPVLLDIYPQCHVVACEIFKKQVCLLGEDRRARFEVGDGEGELERGFLCEL
jgi:hypothetical protein